jgi:hypothetical protein
MPINPKDFFKLDPTLGQYSIYGETAKTNKEPDPSKSKPSESKSQKSSKNDKNTPQPLYFPHP